MSLGQIENNLKLSGNLKFPPKFDSSLEMEIQSNEKAFWLTRKTFFDRDLLLHHSEERTI